MKVQALLDDLDSLAPFQLAEAWDNVGLQVGSPQAEVRRLLVTLDPSEQAIEAALRLRCQAVLTHHPLIFSSLRAVIDEGYPSSVVSRALRDGIAIIAAHTNLDKARGGLAEVAGAILGLEGMQPLQPSPVDWLKLVGFVPADEVDEVRSAVFAAGGGVIGNYGHCSFAIPGTGTFMPLPGATPTVGTPGTDNTTDEVRLEIVFPRQARRAVLDAFVTAHSYEEPAYDVYPVEDEVAGVGFGRVGYLPEPQLVGDLVATIAHTFKVPSLRYLGDPRRRITRVAILPGSGASGIAAAAAKAEALVTGDLKYHDAAEADRLGLTLVDLPHEVAEGSALQRWADRLADRLGRHGVHVEFFSGPGFPWRYAEPQAPPEHLGVDNVTPDEANSHYELYVDGGARGNPGPAGIGARLLTEEGEVAEELADFIGTATNNVAEYQAMIAGLEMALDHGVRRLRVYADSELVVRQLTGQYRVREASLRVLHDQAVRLLHELADVEVVHIPREQNAAADELVNRAIDDAASR
jgi:dinuclear metal center YbgI/SA1388 family protein